MLRAACGSVLYLALIALLSLGAATALREAATAIGTVLGLLYLLPVIATFAGNLGVLAAWAAGALTLGGLLLRRRDA